MGARVAGSDLDIVVMLPDGDPRAPRHESRRYRGWPVELFVHDERSLAHHLTKEFAARKPELHRMVGTGFALVGQPHAWRERCAHVLAGRRTPAGRGSVQTGPAGHCRRPATTGRRRPYPALSRAGTRPPSPRPRGTKTRRPDRLAPAAGARRR